MNCSKCESSNCRSFEIIHQTNTASATSTDVAGAVQIQTNLGKRCSPPKNYFTSLGVSFSLLAGFAALPIGCMSAIRLNAQFPTNIGYGFVAMLITSVALIFIVKSLSRFFGFTGSYERRLAKWSSTFMCLDCGNEIQG